ncbi:SAM-dependent methyltransferase [Chaetomium tenue]|uniref:SAM-dependent methyltransferase n=1 Tax=Chaetomium tenue TaxID=1854479 RepID=A0ACB7P4M7_9PEZI|nr:SAM-dependent methyltransferase [Chaetomium globosum]
MAPTSPPPQDTKIREAQLKTLLACSLHRPELVTKFHGPRFRQRLALVDSWGVREGERVLDIGCGQGESCLVLALKVGDSGHVTAIDPAQPDYGHPFTMREAHEHIRKSVLGPRISYLPFDAPSYLATLDAPAGNFIDSAVMCHSLWYFQAEDVARSLFTTLAEAKIKRIYLAEWSYQPSSDTQLPHILAAKAQALLYRYNTPSEPGLQEQNVRAGVDQRIILSAAREAGYTQERHWVEHQAEDMLEGQFEVDYVLGPRFEQRVVDAGLSEDRRAEIDKTVQQLRAEVERVRAGGKAVVGAMDVWCAVLEL